MGGEGGQNFCSKPQHGGGGSTGASDRLISPTDCTLGQVPSRHLCHPPSPRLAAFYNRVLTAYHHSMSCQFMYLVIFFSISPSHSVYVCFSSLFLLSCVSNCSFEKHSVFLSFKMCFIALQQLSYSCIYFLDADYSMHTVTRMCSPAKHTMDCVALTDQVNLDKYKPAFLSDAKVSGKTCYCNTDNCGPVM